MDETVAQLDSPNIGRWLCLEFSNTLEWHASDHPQESLITYPDLVKWSGRAGILAETEAQKLLREAARHPRATSAVLKRLAFIREVIYRIFSALAAGRQPKKSDLNILNDILSKAMSRSRIVGTAEGFIWDWADGESALDRMLCPIVRSAAELLTSIELERVRECEGVGCGWLFVDVSRNRLRRWCDMKSCGNRAKARRHYERIKTTR